MPDGGRLDRIEAYLEAVLARALSAATARAPRTMRLSVTLSESGGLARTLLAHRRVWLLIDLPAAGHGSDRPV